MNVKKNLTQDSDYLLLILKSIQKEKKVNFKTTRPRLEIKLKFDNKNYKYKNSKYINFSDDYHIKALELEYILQAIGPFNLDDYNQLEVERYVDTNLNMTIVKLILIK